MSEVALKHRKVAAATLAAAGLFILSGCGKSEPEFTPGDVVDRLSLEEVLDAYEERDYDKAMEDLAYHLRDEIELSEVLKWYDVSNYEIAWDKMSEDKNIVWEFLNDNPEIALEFASNWYS